VNASARGRTGVSARPALERCVVGARRTTGLIGLVPVIFAVARLQDPPARLVSGRTPTAHFARRC